MPYARNALDGNRVYFEDDGGNGAAVVLHGGLVDSADLVRESNIAQALQELPTDEFRLIYVDHRGVGRSYKPHEAEAYAMPLRVADVVAVLDELGIERAPSQGRPAAPRGSAHAAREYLIASLLGCLTFASELIHLPAWKVEFSEIRNGRETSAYHRTRLLLP